MKMKLKENKGITLIALIITIIILLILAVVTITAVSEGNIFNHANNAATRYNAAATEENAIITNYLSEMEKHDGEKHDKGDPIDDSDNILVGKTFRLAYMSSNEVKTEDLMVVQSNDTLTFDGDSFKYSYDEANKTLTITTMNMEFDVYELSDNILLHSTGEKLALTSNAGSGLTSLTGLEYKNSESGDTYNFAVNSNYGVVTRHSVSKNEDFNNVYFVINISENEDLLIIEGDARTIDKTNNSFNSGGEIYVLNNN